MDTDRCLVNLRPEQREAIANIIDKIEAKKTVLQKDVLRVGIDPARASTRIVARVFRVSETAVRKWQVEGCPINSDGTMALAEVYAWLKARAEGQTTERAELEKQRLGQQIELGKIDIAERQGKYTTWEYHDRVLGEQALEMHNFLTGSFPANAEHFVGKTDVVEVRKLLLELARQAVEVWINAPAKKLPPLDSAE